MRSIFGIIAIIVCAATAPDWVMAKEAAWHTGHQWIAFSGKRTVVWGYVHMKPDCSVANVTTLQVVKQPAHGTVTIVNEPAFPHAKGNYKGCNLTKVMSSTVYYRSAANYLGSDSLTLRTPSADGRLKDIPMEIDVIK